MSLGFIADNTYHFPHNELYFLISVSFSSQYQLFHRIQIKIYIAEGCYFFNQDI